MSDVPMEVEGVPFVIKNTFIEIVSCRDQEKSTSRRRNRSTPANYRAGCKVTSDDEMSRSDSEETKSSTSTMIHRTTTSRWSDMSDEDDDVETQQSSDEAKVEHNLTTVMIRSLPEGFSRQMLEELLDQEGFAGCYDFMYVPADIASGVSFYYAFVNLVTPFEAERFRTHFTGFDRWSVPCEKSAAVDWSQALQGLPCLIERYRNSPLMHKTVPDNLRPCIYSSGARAVFPPPTVAIKAPRLRRDNNKKIARSA
mmetsp:Transcript_97994/g.204415  ORF Transcript_97994/g.204415 Transcript_97994/m.204415 type:complete len:254 (-) Transcript_97994:166-927(-)